MLAASSGASRCTSKEAAKDAMPTFLFRGLTTAPALGEQLFDAVTAEARRPHFYVEGEVPDTLDGRFAMLATVGALTIVRLEQLGDAGNSLSVALVERFVEVMEAEHRQLGLGDSAVGKTVRRLVGSLSRRTDLWRGAVTGQSDWSDCARQSLYAGQAGDLAVAHSSAGLKALWAKLGQADLAGLAVGRIE
jgi:cytochrome b pre-mRNA-processing protein 3